MVSPRRFGFLLFLIIALLLLLGIVASCSASNYQYRLNEVEEPDATEPSTPESAGKKSSPTDSEKAGQEAISKGKPQKPEDAGREDDDEDRESGPPESLAKIDSLCSQASAVTYSELYNNYEKYTDEALLLHGSIESRQASFSVEWRMANSYRGA